VPVWSEEDVAAGGLERSDLSGEQGDG
jgi:hypothetical protein